LTWGVFFDTLQIKDVIAGTERIRRRQPVVNMRIMRRFMALIVVLSVAAGCVTKPNYFYEAGQSDPELVFNSDFELHTYFYVNVEPASNMACRKFKLAGYILHREAANTRDAPKKEFSIYVPADQEVAVGAYHHFRIDNDFSICGPLYLAFTPKKGETYRVRMAELSSSCALRLAKAGGSPSPVKAVSFKTCRLQ